MAKEKRPWLHTIVYGNPGSRKSSFAATYPVPIYVAHFDAYGKDAPYVRIGASTEDDETDDGVPVRRVLDEKGKLLVELHYFHDVNPEKPDAWELFRREMKNFEPKNWQTFVVDSVTAALMAAKYQQMYKINPGQSGFTALGPATDQLEMQLMRRIASFPCNVVIVCHVAEKYVTIPGMKGQPGKTVDKRVEYEETEEGQTIVLRGLSAPGRLARDKGLISQYAETYRAYITRNTKGEKVWRLQTESDDDWVAASQIPAPDPCEVNYERLWDAVEGQ